METAPDQAFSGRFYIEDVVVRTAAGQYQFYQLKHRQHPEENLWTWDDLLEQKLKKRGGVTLSLLQRWSQSLQVFGNSSLIDEAALITNGIPDAVLANYIVDDRIVLAKIEIEDTILYTRLTNQLGGPQPARAFCNTFKFFFGQPSAEELDQQQQHRFYGELRGTWAGYLGVKDYIYKEANKPHPDSITLAHLRESGEWDRPQPLNEDFALPEDFVLFDEGQHQHLLHQIDSATGGICVFTGKPGSGKSTYLSNLDRQLRNEGRIVIKHHYHISPDDQYSQDRLNTDRVLEAIKYQFKQHEDELGAKAHQNSANIALREFITQVAVHQKQRGKSLIIIIDGLDHALRFWQEKDLKTFLLEVSQPQDGLWLLFGTQEVARHCLPQIILDRCPESTWLTIPGLSIEAVERIITHNTVGLRLPEHDLEPTVSKLFELTEGNPLHLRYTLQEIKNRLINTVAYEHNLPLIAPYGGEISIYYSALWGNLPQSAKTAAIIAVTLEIGLTKPQLVEVINSIEPNPTQVTTSLAAIYHLLKTQYFGALTIFHNSFRIYIESQPHFEEQKAGVFHTVRDWLQASTHEYLKWAELPRLYNLLGNPVPIMNLDRVWIIDAMLDSRREEDITELLDLGKGVSFGEIDYVASLQQNFLYTYTSNVFDYSEEAYPDFWESSFYRHERLQIPANLALRDLPSYQLYHYAKRLHNQGYPEIVKHVIDIFTDRLSSARYRAKDDFSYTLPQTPRYLLQTVCLHKPHVVERVVKFINQYRESNWAIDLLAIYLTHLLTGRQRAKIFALFFHSFEDQELTKLLDTLVDYSIQQHNDQYFSIIRQYQSALSTWGKLFWYVKTGEIVHAPSLPNHDAFPYEILNHDTAQEEELRTNYLQLFLNGVAVALLQGDQVLVDWQAKLPIRRSLQAAGLVIESARYLVAQIKEQRPISYAGMLGQLTHFERADWYEERNQFSIGRAFEKVAPSLLQYCYWLNIVLGEWRSLTLEEYASIVDAKFISRESFLTFLLAQKRRVLEQAPYQLFLDEECRIWQSSVAPFADRAKHYVRLAQLTKLHNDGDRECHLLRLAAENLLGYGGHKDMTLYYLMKGVRICYQAESDQVSEWMRRLAPLVTHAGDYTDGDETRTLIYDYQTLLGQVDLAALRRFYHEALKTEQFELAESSWDTLLTNMPFDQPSQRWLASTAVDSVSYETLNKRAASESGAARALGLIHDALGPRERLPHPSSSATRPSRSVDYKSVPPSDLWQFIREQENEQRFVQDELSDWATYWVNAPGADASEVFLLVQDLVKMRGWTEQTSEFYDVVYPLAYEFDDHFAFDCLVQSQIRDYSWGPYSSQKSAKLRMRWQRLKEDFPERRTEYFARSTQDEGYRTRKGSRSYVPYPHGVDFFIFFDDLATAENITEALLQVVEGSMANLALPTCLWLTASDKDELDLLLARQSWVGSITRERVATAIAGLILETLPDTTVYDRWLAWLSEQQLETVITNGLLPLLKCVEKPDTDTGFIDLRAVNQAMRFSTVVSEEALLELARLTGQSSFKPLLKRRKPLPPPTDFQADNKFAAYAQGFIAGIYFDRAREIEKRYKNVFMRNWAFITEHLITTLDIQVNPYEYRNFLGRDRYLATMTGMSSLTSEVYKTAYVLRLQELKTLRLVADWRYLNNSCETFPVDLSNWKIQAQRCPFWWPSLNVPAASMTPGSPQLDASNSGIVDQVKAILLSPASDHFQIVAFDGAVKPAAGWITDQLDTRVTLIPFAYRVVGPDLPSADEIIEECHLLYGPSIYCSSTKRPYTVIESEHDFAPEWEDPQLLNHLLIYPIVGRFSWHAINLYQAYRLNKSFFGLYRELADGLAINLNGDHIGYYSTSQAYARSYDWTAGITERHEYSLQEPHGQVMEIDAYLSKSLYWIRPVWRLGIYCGYSKPFVMNIKIM